MADNPTSSPQKSLPGGDPISVSASLLQNPNLPSSPMDISSPRSLLPHIPNATQQHQIDQQLHQQIQLQQQQQQIQLQQQQQQMSGTPNFTPQQQRVVSSQIARIQQQYGSAAAVSALRQHAGLYGGQMSFAASQQQQQQAGGGQMSGLSSQAAAAVQFTMQQHQQQLLAQRQKTGAVQASQFHQANTTGQSLQGMQSISMINQLGVKTGQLSPYTQAAQQRLSQGMRQLQSAQTQLSSPQKLPGQAISQATSLASMNSQLSSISQSGQANMTQNPISQQQWLKQTQMAMAGTGSSLHLQQQRQRQALLQQQLQKSIGLNQLNQRQLSHLVQQQSLNVHQQQQHNLQMQQSGFLNQHLPNLQTQQQQLQLQQQQSPRVPGAASQKSLSLTGSQPETPASGATTPGGSSSQGTEATNQLIGKRKIQDLVSQVDSLAKLDHDVEDLLLELADDFIDSVTTFACKIAKLRKSSILEPKDLLLHLEHNLHMSIPGYTREGHRYQKKQAADGIHKRRLEMIQTLVDSTQSVTELSTSKGISKPNIHETNMEGTIRPAGSDQLLLPTAGTPMVKLPQF